jgi:hypothetical protein
MKNNGGEFTNVLTYDINLSNTEQEDRLKNFITTIFQYFENDNIVIVDVSINFADDANSFNRRIFMNIYQMANKIKKENFDSNPSITVNLPTNVPDVSFYVIRNYLLGLFPFIKMYKIVDDQLQSVSTLESFRFNEKVFSTIKNIPE